MSDDVLNEQKKRLPPPPPPPDPLLPPVDPSLIVPVRGISEKEQKDQLATTPKLLSPKDTGIKNSDLDKGSSPIIRESKLLSE